MFDASKDKLESEPIWVRLPNIPLHFWNIRIFMEIRNYLGNYIDVDVSFDETRIVKVARILVILDLKKGL